MDDFFWMKRALFLANNAFFLKKIPIGAVLVYCNYEIGIGFNYSNFNFCSFCHAEIICLKQGVFYSSNFFLERSCLYVTLKPCVICMSSCIFSNINKVIFATYNKKNDFFLHRKFSKFIYLNCDFLENEANLLINKYYNKN